MVETPAKTVGNSQHNLQRLLPMVSSVAHMTPTPQPLPPQAYTDFPLFK